MTRRDRRRLLLASAALLLPLAVRARPAERVHRVVYLTLYRPRERNRYTDHLLDALRELGYVEGRNLAFDYRHADGRVERLPELAHAIVRDKPDVIVTGVNAFTRLAQQATRTIPIVMVVGTDVIREGFVTSLARPGGNITGLAWEAGRGVYTKRIEFLREVLPDLRRVALLWDQGQDAAVFRQVFEEDATAAGLQVIRLEMEKEEADLEPHFSRAVREGAQALATGGGTRLFRQHKRVVELAAKYRLPDTHYDSIFVDAGGLMSYAPSLAGLFRRSATYVDKILRGADPGTLPVEQPTQFDLVINLRTARALGLSIPESLLLRANRVIE
ncbi:MAG: ABC transporter substrate-binding protein [Betaproteobacteria bacterium]|nr:ABC transporter substrate-binding protein [Betaproteobacteria bacterium]